MAAPPPPPAAHPSPRREKPRQNLTKVRHTKFIKTAQALQAEQVVSHSLRGIRYFGSSYCYWFLEVCSGIAILTQAVRLRGLTVLEPVDIKTGWDLTKNNVVQSLKNLIREWRPLHTHFAPVCRIFSVAFQPLMAEEYVVSDTHYKADMTLALNIARLAEFVRELGLFVCIENPLASRIYKLAPYVRLGIRPGFFFVDLNLCMYKYLHPVTGELVWKGLRLLTNAPWMISMGEAGT